jgi:hypothetical protein
MTKDPAETMRILVEVRAAIASYQKEHGTGPGETLGLFGDVPMECFFLLSNSARTATEDAELGQKIGALKARCLDLSRIASAPQVVLA